MKIKFFLSIIISFLFLFIICKPSNAEIYKVNFNAQTTNYNDPTNKQVNFWAEVFDTEKKNPPEFVDSIRIIAPDGTVLNMDPVHSWLPFDEGYWGRLFEGDFVGPVPFVGGVYKCEVIDKAGKKITKSDVLKRAFLPTTSITNLSDGDVDVPLTPTIRWEKVKGAWHYRILIWDETWNEPLYWFWKKNAFTDENEWKIPLGDLQLLHDYRIRIEARASEQDLDKRSRSDWIFFTTTSTP